MYDIYLYSNYSHVWNIWQVGFKTLDEAIARVRLARPYYIIVDSGRTQFAIFDADTREMVLHEAFII